jgi:hypothetical protein
MTPGKLLAITAAPKQATQPRREPFFDASSRPFEYSYAMRSFRAFVSGCTCIRLGHLFALVIVAGSLANAGCRTSDVFECTRPNCVGKARDAKMIEFCETTKRLVSFERCRSQHQLLLECVEETCSEATGGAYRVESDCIAEWNTSNFCEGAATGGQLRGNSSQIDSDPLSLPANR